MGSIDHLTDDQINDLQEVGNVGAGQAAACLSDLVDRRCLIDIPKVAHMDAASVQSVFQLQESIAVAIHVRILGDIPGVMLIVTKRICAQKIVGYMTKSAAPVTGKHFDFTATFALKQVGEAMTRAFSGAISQYIKTRTKYAMPEIVTDIWSSVWQSVAQRFWKNDENYLVVHSSFYDPEKTFSGHCVYMFDRDSQQALMERLAALWAEALQ
ncbi:MAG: chemotaxis protein CheC [Elusimicrobia bacterium]|nr:chemotaxis protein CheC [Elusimicrobiota bacterium]